MADTFEKLGVIAGTLQAYLSTESFDANCTCRACDALRPVNQALEGIKEIRSLLCKTASPQERAETLSRKVADRQRPLAVAQEISQESARYNLWFNGTCIYSGWVSEVFSYCKTHDYDLTFV